MEEKCKLLRDEIRDLGVELRELLAHGCYESDGDFVGQHSEMKANTMLAYRHLEDARMRLGKVIQQIHGGTSIYD